MPILFFTLPGSIHYPSITWTTTGFHSVLLLYPSYCSLLSFSYTPWCCLQSCSFIIIFLSFIPVKSCPSWWLPCLYSHLQALHLPFCHISSNTDFQNLHQLVSSPTHFSHSGSPSVIDLVFVPPPFLLMSLIFLLLVLLTMYRFFCL